MSNERSPEEIAAERLLADPGLMQRRLNHDLADIAALDRTGVRVDPNADRAAVSETLRAGAGQLGFESPIEAATQTKRRLIELPVVERSEGTQAHAYHASASTTVRQGHVTGDVTDSSGVRIVEFQRRATDTDLVGVTLSARVRVETDGQAWLDSYGWPAPPHQPVHTFVGDSEALLTQALSDLADTAVPFDRPLLLLFGATLKVGGEVGDRQRRVQVAERVLARKGELSAYAGQAENYALASAGDGWYAACLYRSALENLFEVYLGGATFSVVDAEEIDDIDEALRRGLPQAGGTTSTAIPEGVPVHHWWWTLPAE